MPATYANAIDEICWMANAAWKTGAEAIAGYIPEIRWPGNPKGSQVPMDKFRARVSHQIVTSEQSSLADESGSKRFHTVGLLFVQIFCPRTVADPLGKGTALAELIRTRFRQRSITGIIWFRDQKITRLPESSENYPINVVVTFEFDTVERGDGALSGDVPDFSGGDSVAGLQRHLPAEAPDGAIHVFTFAKLPASFVLIWNGLIQDGYARVGDVITVDVAPEVGAEFYVLY